MCGIAGFSGFNLSFKEDMGRWENVFEDIDKASQQSIKGDIYIKEHTASINGVSRVFNGLEYFISYTGEIYNKPELKTELEDKGYSFKSDSDEEIILCGFDFFGVDYIRKINGIFSLAIWDAQEETLYLVRDRLGIKPLFYTMKDKTLIFGSAIKFLLQFPTVEARLDRNGVSEIFGLGPARTPGIGVFKDFYEVLPGHYTVFNKNEFKEVCYWKLNAKPHEDNHDDTVENIKFLLIDSVEKQITPDVPLCTLLSGGVDSTIVTALTAKYMQEKHGKTIDTFSFDYEENSKHFKSSSFQPDEDRPWVDKAVKTLNTNHTYLECSNQTLADYLYKSVDAKDLPGMGDIDSSLLFFCEQITKTHKIALSGECSDEFFGGYPWFHKQDMLDANTFPWSRDMNARKQLLNRDLISSLDLETYTQMRYKNSIDIIPTLKGEAAEEKRRREISHLTMHWFMTTLIDRMERIGTYTGLNARVPYADHRIVEYLFNIPWELKRKDDVVKYLLRKSCEGILPNELLYRKKSPYPKTYNPGYEQLLINRLKDIFDDKNSLIHDLIDSEKINAFMQAPAEYGKPWFGQLMAGPQQMAYVIQIDYWLKKYKVKINI